jgi:hypothetical protein
LVQGAELKGGGGNPGGDPEIELALFLTSTYKEAIPSPDILNSSIFLGFWCSELA